MIAVTRRPATLALAFSLLAEVALAVTFETETLTVPTDDGAVTLTIEIADTPERRARGYMERVDIASDEGMLFVHEDDRFISMWMRNTPTSLDMIFLEADGTVESVAADTEPFSPAIIESEDEVRFVLEVLAGSAAAWGLEPGDRLEGPRFER